MKLKKSTIEDLKIIMSIIDDAKKAMKDMKIDQWQSGDPNEAVILNDIKNGNSYLAVDEKNNILAHGTLIFGVESTYNKIIDGSWKNDKDGYGTLHRIATACTHKRGGIASFIFSAFEKEAINKGIHFLRVDTHKDNILMQNLIEKFNYTRSGIIFVSDGTQRIVYEKCLN